MTDRPMKIENLEQQQEEELPPEQAEQAEGGIIINGRPGAERGLITEGGKTAPGGDGRRRRTAAGSSPRRPGLPAAHASAYPQAHSAAVVIPGGTREAPW